MSKFVTFSLDWFYWLCLKSNLYYTFITILKLNKTFRINSCLKTYKGFFQRLRILGLGFVLFNPTGWYKYTLVWLVAKSHPTLGPKILKYILKRKREVNTERHTQEYMSTDTATSRTTTTRRNMTQTKNKKSLKSHVSIYKQCRPHRNIVVDSGHNPEVKWRLMVFNV